MNAIPVSFEAETPLLFTFPRKQASEKCSPVFQGNHFSAFLGVSEQFQRIIYHFQIISRDRLIDPDGIHDPGKQRSRRQAFRKEIQLFQLFDLICRTQRSGIFAVFLIEIRFQRRQLIRQM